VRRVRGCLGIGMRGRGVGSVKGSRLRGHGVDVARPLIDACQSLGSEE
jgi:hypothetical protein